MPTLKRRHTQGSLSAAVIIMLSLLAACASPPAPRPPQPSAASASGTAAIIHATLIPMTETGLMIPDATILIRDGRIAAAGPAGSVAIPEDAVLHDATGRWVVPGLADAHVHLLFNPADPLLFLANGVTTVRDMGAPTDAGKNDPSLAFDDHLALRSATASGSILGPTIVAASPIHEAPTGLYFDRRVYAPTITPEDGRRAVRAAMASGFDAFKVYNRLPADAFWAAAGEARRIGLPVVGHVPHEVPIEEVLRSGAMHSIEHGSGYLHFFEGFKVDPADLPRLAGLAAAAGIWHIPTLEVWRSAVPADQANVIAADPWARYVPASTRTIWRSSLAGFERMIHDRVPHFVRLPSEHFGDFELLFRELAAAGVPIAAGTDAGTMNVVAGSSLHRELAHYVRLGMSPWQALASATSEAAHCFGTPGEFGVIAPGARADLLILQSDPLADISALDDLETVWLRGVPYSRNDLRSALESMRQSFTFPEENQP